MDKSVDNTVTTYIKGLSNLAEAFATAEHFGRPIGVQIRTTREVIAELERIGNPLSVDAVEEEYCSCAKVPEPLEPFAEPPLPLAALTDEGNAYFKNFTSHFNEYVGKELAEQFVVTLSTMTCSAYHKDDRFGRRVDVGYGSSALSLAVKASAALREWRVVLRTPADAVMLFAHTEWPSICSDCVKKLYVKGGYIFLETVEGASMSNHFSRITDVHAANRLVNGFIRNCLGVPA